MASITDDFGQSINFDALAADGDSIDWPDPEPIPAYDPVECQRSGFDRGDPVILADGQTWFLPVPDVALLLATPGLVSAAKRCYQLAGRLADTSDGSAWIIAQSSLQHELRQVAGLLLARNYDLRLFDRDLDDDCPELRTARWGRLLDFGLLASPEQTHFETIVMDAILNAFPVWVGLLTNHTPLRHLTIHPI